MAEAPTCFTVVSWFFIGLGLLCAGVILYDVFGRGYRQRIGAMEAVWPITAVYFDPLSLWAYYRWGVARRAASGRKSTACHPRGACPSQR